MSVPLALTLAFLLVIPTPLHAADGDLDVMFGIGGRVHTDFEDVTSATFARASTIQHDGKIIAAGCVGKEFALLRYDSDGFLDATFGEMGLVTTDLSEPGHCFSAVAIQSD